MGNKRSNVTEADEDVEYTLPSPSNLKRSNGNAKVDTSGQQRTGPRSSWRRSATSAWRRR